jgi:hypothetical protein
LGVLGAFGFCATLVATVTIIPVIPNGWAMSAGGFPATDAPVAFLMKDVALLAASFYSLEQDAVRVVAETKSTKLSDIRKRQPTPSTPATPVGMPQRTRTRRASSAASLVVDADQL